MEADKYEVLSFDCYGTLVDWESGIIAGLRPVLRGHGIEPPTRRYSICTPRPSISCKPPRRGSKRKEE